MRIFSKWKVKMGFPVTRFTAIAFCLVSTVTQNFGELILIRQSPTDNDETRKLTCISDDADAALIWNYKSSVEASNAVKNFQPKKPRGKSVTECAIWDSTKCLAQWEEKNGWDVVNSVNKPMGPVFDYRWEGFDEFVFENTAQEHQYKYVTKVKKSSNTVIFSVRGKRDVYIFLCETTKPQIGRCYWIIIGGWGGSKSAIRFCHNGAPNPKQPIGHCEDTVNVTHGTEEMINADEWRTFVLKRNNNTQTIEVFKDNSDEPFLRRKFEQWPHVPHVSIRGVTGTRFRFHFYKYFLTENRDAIISATEFNYNDKNFCVELLVGLCPNCKLDVNLIDREGSTINVGNISGGEKDTVNKLLKWRLVKLDLKSFDQKRVKLEMKTILIGNKRRGQWAIDDFHTCNSVGKLRESTIMVHRDLSTRTWPSVKCQKLSYSENALVDSLSTITNYHGKNLLQQFTSKLVQSCGSPCTRFGEHWSFCTPSECACMRRFEASNCIKELGKPTALDVTDSTARVLQKIELEAAINISSVYFLVKPLHEGAAWREFFPMRAIRSQIMYEKKVQNLNPKTTYNIHTVIHVDIAGRSIAVNSPVDTFTTSVGERCFGVVRGKTSITVHLYKLLKGCPEILGINYRKLPSEEFRNMYGVKLPWNISELTPYTEYEIELPGLGKNVFSATIRTLESAPEQVRYFTTSNVTDTGATIGWAPPSEINGIITKYSVSIKRHTLFGCVDLKLQTPPQNEKLQNVSIARAVLTGLHPYANYTVTVIAHTLEPGPPNTYEFQTPEAEIPTSVVSDLRLDDEQRFLKWDMPANCTTISGPTKGTKLIFAGVSEWAKDFKETKSTTYLYFELKKLNLTSYTTYKVRAFVIRDNLKPENPSRYQELNWTTAASAPPAVTQLRIYDADPYANTISLRWAPPYPPCGELESYHVSINNGNTRLNNWTITPPKNRLECNLWEDYACFESMNIPSNVEVNSQIQIYAKNRHVKESGDLNVIGFVTDIYSKAPGKASEFMVIFQDHGITTVKWPHPFSMTKITQFRINVKYLETKLLENPDKKSVILTRDITQNEKEYHVDLHLAASTTYGISIESVNQRNLSSTTEKKITVPDKFAFANGEKLKAEQNGSVINLKVPAIVNAKQNTRVHAIVNGLFTCANNQLQSSSSPVNPIELIVAVYEAGEKTSKSFTIGVNQSNSTGLNCSLHIGKTYEIKVIVKERYTNKKTLIGSILITLIDSDLIVLWSLLAILPVIMIFILLLFVYRRLRKLREQGNSDAIPLSEVKHLSLLMKQKSPRHTIEKRVSSHIYAELFKADSRVVSIDFFPEYAQNAATNGLLLSQYMIFPRGLTKKCDYGKLPKNVSKNRNPNIIPYDENRVILEKIPDDPYSDYINASYIEGYHKDKTYIATQGPMPNTVNDFWRMIWQQKVHVICMLTNVVEDGKTKCEQYWPEVGTRVKYGDVSVLNMSHQVFADYIIRTFRINSQKCKRKVTHLHYTEWPADGIPIYTQSLVTYLRKLVEIPVNDGPVVVHCSIGIGRTGTIILCDTCLHQALANRVIDVQGVTNRMREGRADMVGSPQQYLFAHVIIMESIMFQSTQVPCTDDFPNQIKKMREQLPSDIARLNNTAWQEQALYSLMPPQSPTPGDFARKRLPELNLIYPDVVYFERHSTCNNGRNNYIGTVSVDGVTRKKQYLASRLPSNSTRSNFWRLIASKNVELIIMLQRPDPGDPTCCDMMSGESTVASMPLIKVKTRASLVEEEHFTVQKLLLIDGSGKETRFQPVTLLTCTGWGQGKDGKPPATTDLVSLWKAAENIPRKEAPALVLCQNGVTGCGLYLALSFMLERMAVERECDVISAVRAVRRFRPDFVQSLEQFEYLYDAAMDFVECFQTYANFT